MRQATVPVLIAKSRRQHVEGLCAVEDHCGKRDTDMKVITVNV